MRRTRVVLPSDLGVAISLEATALAGDAVAEPVRERLVQIRPPIVGRAAGAEVERWRG